MLIPELPSIMKKDMEEVLKIKPLKYESHVSFENKLFMKLMKWIKK